MQIIADPLIPDSYKITVTDYHLCKLAYGSMAAENLYRKRISALAGWIKRKKKSWVTESFIDIYLEIACEDAERLAKSLFEENPKQTSLSDWGLS